MRSRLVWPFTGRATCRRRSTEFVSGSSKPGTELNGWPPFWLEWIEPAPQ